MDDTYTLQQIQDIANDAAQAAVQADNSSISLGGIVSLCLQIILWGCIIISQRRGSKQNQDAAEKQLVQASDNAEEIKRQLADNTAKISENTEMLNKIDDTLEADTKVSVATARTALKSVYDRLLPNRRLTMTEKAMVTEMYNAYKSVTYPDGHHPNSWCDEIIRDIETWEVVPDGYTPTRLKTPSKAKKGRK